MRLTKIQKEVLEKLPDNGEIAISHRYSHSWGYLCGAMDDKGSRDIILDWVSILTIRSLEKRGLLVKVFDGQMAAGRVEAWHKPCDPSLGVQGVTGSIGQMGSNEPE